MKSPVVEQPATPGADVRCEKPGDRRWLPDALEDDEVRKAQKDDAAFFKADGRTAHD
ncbi:hypothetical protein [Bradyrhizobium elkanii]|uniref:hypothetical protein n=1 Tax=Bradyrhizobium elkanii TaxID=29448 RepID=UPI001AECEFA3|nr:hypothetical protein [Bradyrhizobium elkanii]